MSGLVSYESSDEDDEQHATVPVQPLESTSSRQEVVAAPQERNTNVAQAQSSRTSDPVDTTPTALAASEVAVDEPELEDDPRLSPYSRARAKIQSVTMPRHADFDIPPSPPPPDPTSEEAADLLARTRKFERFLQLKKQGTHFNARLESSTALRNPALLQKLLDFAGIEAEDQYDNTLGEDFGVPMKWPDGFLESLLKSNEKRVKKEKDGRTKINFVSAKQKKNG